MEKIKIAISPEDRSSNVYHKDVLWNGERTNEHVQMCRFADALEQHLVRCGFEVYNMQFGNMFDRVAYANRMGADLYIAPHSNGYNSKARGCRIHCYPSERSRAFGKLLVDGVKPICTSDMPEPRLVEEPVLYELRTPAAPAVLPEWAFHDNKLDAEWIIANIDKLAEMTAKACCTYFDKDYVSRETARMYRIQLGAFRNKTYAENMLKTVQTNYPDAFIVESEE